MSVFLYRSAANCVVAGFKSDPTVELSCCETNSIVMNSGATSTCDAVCSSRCEGSRGRTRRGCDPKKIDEGVGGGGGGGVEGREVKEEYEC